MTEHNNKDNKGKGNLLNGGVEFAHAGNELSQDEIMLLRGLFAQRAEKKAANALSVLKFIDGDTSRLLAAYLGESLELVQEGLNLLIHQERNRANRLRSNRVEEATATATATVETDNQTQSQAKIEKPDWRVIVMDGTNYLLIGLVVLAAALLFAAYSWYVEHRRITRRKRLATSHKAASKFGRAAKASRKVRKEQGRD